MMGLLTPDQMARLPDPENVTVKKEHWDKAIALVQSIVCTEYVTFDMFDDAEALLKELGEKP